MRTKKMALLLLLIMLSIHLHASSYPSQNLLVSAFDQQEDHNVGDKRSRGQDVSTSRKVASGGETVVGKRGGGGGGGHGSGGGGHGGGGHSGSGGRSAGESNGDATGKGYAAVVPLFAAGSGAHHVNNRHHGKNGGTTTYIGLPLLASGVLISLFIAQPI